MQTRSKQKFQAIFNLGVSLIDSTDQKQGTDDKKMHEQPKQPIHDIAQGQLNIKSQSKASLLQMKMRQLKRKKIQTEQQQKIQASSQKKSQVQNIVNEMKNQEQNVQKDTPESDNKSGIEQRKPINEKQQISPQKKQVSNKLTEYLAALKKKKSLQSKPVNNSIEIAQSIKSNQPSIQIKKPQLTAPSALTAQQDKVRLLALDQLKDKQILRIRQKIREEGIKKLQQQLKQLRGKQNLEKKKSQQAQIPVSKQRQVAPQISQITIQQTNNKPQIEIQNKKYKEKEQQIQEEQCSAQDEQQNQQQEQQEQQGQKQKQKRAEVPTHRITTIYKQEEIQQRQYNSDSEGNSPNYNQGYQDEDNEVNYKYSEEDVLEESESEYPVQDKPRTQNNPELVIQNVEEHQQTPRHYQNNNEWLKHPIVDKQITDKWTKIQYKISVKQAYKLTNMIKKLQRTIGHNQNSAEITEAKNQWRQTLRNIQLLQKLVQP